jgi:hypothetical protein
VDSCAEAEELAPRTGATLTLDDPDAGALRVGTWSIAIAEPGCDPAERTARAEEAAAEMIRKAPMLRI